MTQLAKDISSLNVAGGTVAVFWLAQAGFVIKTSTDQLIWIDACLSDYCQTMPGNALHPKRIFPAPLKVSEVTKGLLIATHAHGDHLDPEIVRFASAHAPEVQFAGPTSSVSMMKQFGAPADRIQLLEEKHTYDFDGFSIRAVHADHGEDEPDAIGVIVETDGIRIYHTGDTCYCPEKMGEVIDLEPDVIIPCINGTFGNMNAIEAAKLAGKVGARIAIPSHFWFFVCQNTMAEGMPAAFLEACRERAPATEPVILTVGEPCVVTKS